MPQKHSPRQPPKEEEDERPPDEPLQVNKQGGGEAWIKNSSKIERGGGGTGDGTPAA